MTIRHLDSLLRPSAVAVVGASRNPMLPGGMAFRRLRQGGFAGPVLAVNRRAAAVDGAPAYADVDDLPLVPDLAILAVAPRETARIVAALGRRGCRGFALLPGQGDVPKDGEGRPAAVLAAARPWLGRVLGPDCFGVMVPSLRLNASLAPDLPRPGHLACITLSNAVAATMLSRVQAAGIGISALVGAGAGADIDLADLLDYLALDAATHVIALHLQTVPDGRKFTSALRAASRMKPVIACRTGGGGEEDPSTDAIYDAVLRRAGALRVQNVDDLFDAAVALSGRCRPRGGRVAIAGNGRGLAAMAADAAVATGLQPQGRPVDIGDHAPAARYPEIIAALAAADGAAAVLLAHAPNGLVPTAEIVAAIAGGPVAAGAWVAACLAEAGADDRAILGAAGVTLYADPVRAVRGLALALRHRQLQGLVQHVPAHAADGAHPVPGSGGDGRLLLDAYGITAIPPGVRAGLCADPVFGPLVWLSAAAGAPRSFGLPPLDPVLAADLCRDTVAEGLTELVMALGRIAIDHPGIRELSVGATGGRPCCRILRQAQSKAPRLAIRPYPGELAATIALRDGTAVSLRPVRPGDAPMMDDLFEHLTPDDVHTRFFSTLRTLPPALRARLTQIDYDREMALVATTEGGGEACLVGMVHLLADPDFETAEFAIMVRSDWQGRGVGHVLMQAIVAYARGRGLRRILGIVLNQNGRMLGLARRLGFTTGHGRDPGTTEVALDL